MAIAVGDLKALAGQGHRAITAACAAFDGAADGLAQALGIRTVTPGLRGITVALQRGGGDLRVRRLLVIAMHPDLGDLVEPVQMKRRTAA